MVTKEWKPENIIKLNNDQIFLEIIKSYNMPTPFYIKTEINEST